ncbi:MAG TPA: alpha/beta fold hydrolase [Acidimicrobiales bacterium]|nr:alpha/beta fold hydrolase [Acidimicrobiales bacterium]
MTTARSSGHPRGRPRVVLVHGAVERARGFDEVVAYLGDVDVVTYDRRGHGERWREGTASLAEDADELVVRLDGRPSTVVGHSLGGLVALLASLRRPDLVDGLGLYETAVPWGAWWSDEERTAMLAEVDGNVDAARDEASAGRDAASADRLVVAWDACRRQVLDALAAPFDWQAAIPPVTTGRGEMSDGYSARDAGIVARHYGREPRVVAGAGHRAHRTHPGGFAAFVHGCVPLLAG